MMRAGTTTHHASRPRDDRAEQGFSLIEVLIVVALLGVIATIAVPQLLNAFERARQRRTLADMRAIAGANGNFRVDFGEYADGLTDLAPDYMDPVPPADGWGNGWTYRRNDDDYWLTSSGRDGAGGPAAPDPWFGEPFEADLVLRSGVFAQAPTHGR